MALKSWAFRSISFLAIFGPSVAFSDPLGRFGWHEMPTFDGWEANLEGVRPNYPSSDWLKFDKPITHIKLLETNGAMGTYGLVSTEHAPTKMRLNCFGMGPEFYFQRGFRLHISSLGAPLLSWKEGSVGERVPTPLSKWIALSYQDNQPPIVFTFNGRQKSMIVNGRPGDWVLEPADNDEPVWVRMGLPIGSRPLTTTTAASLGELVTVILRSEGFWSSPSPKLLERKAEVNGDTVVGSWIFSGPYATLPQAIEFCSRADYPLTVLSPTEDLDPGDPRFKLEFSKSRTLQVRFPLRYFLPFRAILAGRAKVASQPVDTIGGTFVRSIQSLLANCSPEVAKELRDSSNQFLQMAEYSRDPMSGQSFPFSAEGTGVDRVAVNALSEVCLNRTSSGVLPFFSSISWAMDASWWQLPFGASDPSRRALGLFAIAGAMSDDPNKRLDACMAYTAMCAERQRARWIPSSQPTFVEPVDGFLSQLFSSKAKEVTSPLLAALLSPYRMVSGPPLVAHNFANGFSLGWTANNKGAGTIQFLSPLILKIISATNVTGTSLHSIAGPTGSLIYSLSFVASAPGSAEVKFSFAGHPMGLTNSNPVPVPKAPAVQYFEKRR